MIRDLIQRKSQIPQYLSILKPAHLHLMSLSDH